MTFAKHIVRGLAVGALAVGLSTAAPAQNATNWHTLSNGLDALYLGIGGGSGQVGGVDGMGTWVDGNDLRGNYVTGLADFGYRNVSFFTSECVLGGPPALALNFPAIVFIEYAGRNNNAQDIFTRPACVGGLPVGTTTGGALPYGLSPGASANFFLTGLPSGAGLPSTTVILIPNNGLAPGTAAGGTATIIAAAGANLGITSTGFCWNVEFTWLPSALLSLDNIDGWWHWQTNSVNNNQYWAMSNDELNSYSSNSVGLVGGGVGLAAFFGSTEYEWHLTSRDPTLNTALNPAGINGTGPYYAATTAAPFNPNGGWDVGRHGGVSISGLGGTLNPTTGLGTQNPTNTPAGGVPTYGYMSWDNEPFVPGPRTVWHQVDWSGVFGVDPSTGARPDALVGPGTSQRLPISVTSGVFPPPGWPQAVTTGQWSLMFHTATAGHVETDPLGFPAGAFGVQGKWTTTNHLPIGGLAPVCAIGLPVVIDGGSTGVQSNLSDFNFDPSQTRISVSTSVTVLD